MHNNRRVEQRLDMCWVDRQCSFERRQRRIRIAFAAKRARQLDVYAWVFGEYVAGLLKQSDRFMQSPLVSQLFCSAERGCDFSLR